MVLPVERPLNDRSNKGSFEGTGTFHWISMRNLSPRLSSQYLQSPCWKRGNTTYFMKNRDYVKCLSLHMHFPSHNLKAKLSQVKIRLLDIILFKISLMVERPLGCKIQKRTRLGYWNPSLYLLKEPFPWLSSQYICPIGIKKQTKRIYTL